MKVYTVRCTEEKGGIAQVPIVFMPADRIAQLIYG